MLHFASDILADVFTVCEKRFVLDLDVHEAALLVRAIDRFYRRLAATSQLMPGGVAYQTSSISVLLRVAERHIDAVLAHLTQQTQSHMKLARTQLAHMSKQGGSSTVVRATNDDAASNTASSSTTGGHLM